MFPPAAGIGFFWLQSALNHACGHAATTIVTTTDQTAMAEAVVIARRRISVGEELTFDYLFGQCPDDPITKCEALSRQYKFVCCCSECHDRVNNA